MSNNSTRGRSECWHVSVTVHSLDSQRVKVSKRQANVSVCSRFIELVTRALRPLILIPAIAFADPVSQHNEPHAGIQAAIDRLDAAGCTRYSITRSGQYVLNSTTDQDAFNLVGNTITIRCMAKVQPVAISHHLTWQHANIRTDGTAMQLSEVAGYDLERNAEVTQLGAVTSVTVDDSSSGVDVYRIRTVDVHNLRGPWSVELRL